MKIFPDHKYLQYSGRIDFDEKRAPEFVFPCSYVKMRFCGSGVKARICNRNNYWDNYLGVIVDGVQTKVKLENIPEEQELVLAENLQENAVHELMLFKRQDSCHVFLFLGFEVEGNAEIFPCAPKPGRRIEVYGDSVSAGEVSEAVAYAGKPDPEHNGEYSNSWYSYAWMTARKLNAQIHDIAQGGIALMDDTGWFNEPEALGMESVYDKISYNPVFGESKKWDFKKYCPHVVIIAIGQNDNHPYDYMKEDYECKEAIRWRAHYKNFVETLRAVYPNAQIILTTTVLCHDPNWDRAIEEVCCELQDVGVHHFLYSDNGCGTPGHIRISEAERMSDELSAYIESLGEQIWEDRSDVAIRWENGIANRGNLARLKQLMHRAKNGEKITLGFLGGSITQGSLATRPEFCYAYRVFEWWKKNVSKGRVYLY